MPDRTRLDVLVVADGASIHTRRLLRALGERDLRVELATFESTEIPGLVEHRLGTSPPDRDSRYLFGVGALVRVIRVRRPEERERLVISMRRLDPDMRVETVVLGFRRACELEPGLLAGWRLLVAGHGTRAQAVRTAAAGDPAIELAGHSTSRRCTGAWAGRACRCPSRSPTRRARCFWTAWPRDWCPS